MSWIIPFSERSFSGAYNQNFLYRGNNNIYIMDNHRAALWCWLQHLGDDTKPLKLCHIDRHSDTLQSNLDDWMSQVSQLGSIKDMSIDEYLDTPDKIFSKNSVKLFRWDNYLSIFLELYSPRITSFIVSYYEGDAPNFDHVEFHLPWELVENIDFWLQSGNWILNIDFDYFYQEIDEGFIQIYSDSFIQAFFRKVKAIIDRHPPVATTLCLSPECCGGWANAEHILDIAEIILSTNIRLD